MKLIWMPLNAKNVECSYIEDTIFSKLMGAGFVRWDGVWLQHPQLWVVFFDGLARGRCNV